MSPASQVPEAEQQPLAQLWGVHVLVVGQPVRVSRALTASRQGRVRFMRASWVKKTNQGRIKPETTVALVKGSRASNGSRCGVDGLRVAVTAKT